MSHGFPKVAWITWYSLQGGNGAGDDAHAVVVLKHRPDGSPGIYGSRTMCGQRVGFLPVVDSQVARLPSRCSECVRAMLTMTGKPRLDRVWVLGFIHGGNGRPASDNPYNEPGSGARTSRPAFREAWNSGWSAAAEWRRK